MMSQPQLDLSKIQAILNDLQKLEPEVLQLVIDIQGLLSTPTLSGHPVAATQLSHALSILQILQLILQLLPTILGGLGGILGGGAAKP
jgi:hypothetical protein